MSDEQRLKLVPRAVPKKSIDAVIAWLEETLEQARKGDVRGVAILRWHGGACSVVSAGTYSFPEFLAAIEDWKFIELAERNLEQINK